MARNDKYRVRTIVKASKASNGERVIEYVDIKVDPAPRVTVMPWEKGRKRRVHTPETHTVLRGGKWVQVGSDNLTAHIEAR